MGTYIINLDRDGGGVIVAIPDRDLLCNLFDSASGESGGAAILPAGLDD